MVLSTVVLEGVTVAVNLEVSPGFRSREEGETCSPVGNTALLAVFLTMEVFTRWNTLAHMARVAVSLGANRPSGYPLRIPESRMLSTASAAQDEMEELSVNRGEMVLLTRVRE